MKLLAILVLLVTFGCLMQTTAISDIHSNPDKYVGQQVLVKGVVQNSMKIGDLSGFTLSDGNYTIGVKSDTLPPVGTQVSVKGTVVKDTVFGYYILSSDVSWNK